MQDIAGAAGHRSDRQVVLLVAADRQDPGTRLDAQHRVEQGDPRIVIHGSRRRSEAEHDYGRPVLAKHCQGFRPVRHRAQFDVFHGYTDVRYLSLVALDEENWIGAGHGTAVQSHDVKSNGLQSILSRVLEHHWSKLNATNRDLRCKSTLRQIL